MKKILNVFFKIVAMFTLFSSSIYATSVNVEVDESDNFEHISYNNYYIKSYDVNIKVNDDNSFDITENIVAFFETSKHGIFRKIPLKNEVKRLDGTKSKNIAIISNLEVSEDYITSKESWYKTIKIGNENKEYSGEKEYTIKYNYNIGKDPLKKEDELYFNIIGNEWDTTIYNITFSIDMPKDFDSSTLGFSSGKIGSTDSSNIEYKVNGNNISGKYLSYLYPEEAFTVRLALPEGYFKNAQNNTFAIIKEFVKKIGNNIYFFVTYYFSEERNNISLYSKIIISIFILSIIIIFCWWLHLEKKNFRIDAENFTPLKDFNSLENGFFYKGKAENKDVVSLLIYLANKGYIKLEPIKRKGFKICKLKEYDGKNKYEKMFFDGIFQFGETVTTKTLKKRFYVTVDEILNEINRENIRKKILKPVSLVIEKVFMVVANLILLLTIESDFLMIFIIDSSIFLNVCIIQLVIIPVIIGIAFLCNIFPNKISKEAGIWCSILGGVIYFALLINSDLGVFLVNVIAILTSKFFVIFSEKIRIRTEFGNKVYVYIKGFKRFLKNAEKKQLEDIVEKYPEYFYNIFPYTYALRISNKWIKHFKEITIKSPNWCSSDNFEFDDFNRMITYSMNTTERAMISKPSESSSDGSSSSDSGSSGGESSGGGSGGRRRRRLVIDNIKTHEIFRVFLYTNFM